MSFQKALNDSVRAGLLIGKKSAKKFVQKTYALGAVQMFRWDRALVFADALEDAELIRKLALRK